MKRIYLFVITICLPVLVFCQNLKPTIMVVPADIYMNNHGWLDDQGNPDYDKAFKNDNKIRLAVSKLSEFMGKEGFPLVNLEAQLKGLQNEQIRNEYDKGRDGSDIELSVLDQIFMSTQPDIRLDLDYSLDGGGMKKKLLYNLQAINTYTFKNIATASGTGPGTSSNDIATLLQVAIKDNMDNFNSQLTTHFHDLVKNGREIKIQIKLTSGATDEDIYLYSEYDYEEYNMDDELIEIIAEWFYLNAQSPEGQEGKGMFNQVGGSDVQQRYENVRMPTVDSRGRSQDAYKFINGLKKILKKDPFNFNCSISRVGLGEAWLKIEGLRD